MELNALNFTPHVKLTVLPFSYFGPPVHFGQPTLRDSILSNGGGSISRTEVRKRAGEAMLRDLPTFLRCENTAKEWAIIGGGPSINDCVKDIRKLQKRGVNIVSVNKSHDWLLENAIIPWGHVLLDPGEHVKDYVKRPRRDVRYFVASQCHPSVFEALDEFPVFLWHAGQDFPEGPEPNEYLKQYWSSGKHPWMSIPGDTTVTPRAAQLGHILNADHFHMFGMDSSRDPNGKFHGYDKAEKQETQCPDLILKHRGVRYQFSTNADMARQYADFDKFVEDLAKHYDSGKLRKSFTMTIYGSGLLPTYAATIGWHAKPECNAHPSKLGGIVYMEGVAA